MGQRAPKLIFGVRARLLMAFLAICLLSLVGTVFGFLSLSQVGRSLGRITGEQVPHALSWLELSRQAERVVRAAPALLAVTTEDERAQVSTEITAQAVELNNLLLQTGSYAAADNARTEAKVQPLVKQFNQNLADLEDLVKKRIFIATL